MMIWISGRQPEPQSNDGNLEIGNIEENAEDEKIITKLEELIDAAIDIGGEAALKTLGEKLNARVWTEPTLEHAFIIILQSWCLFSYCIEKFSDFLLWLQFLVISYTIQ